VFTFSVFVGGNWAWGGITVDWIFFSSGVIGWAMMIRYWNPNNQKYDININMMRNIIFRRI